MKLDPILSKAASLARKRDYNGAFRVLKAGEEGYSDSFKYYYLYGLICLYAGNFAEALINFRYARKIKLNDTSVMLGIASLYLKRMDTVQAVDLYLDIQEIDPDNKIAKKALGIIRENSSPESLSDWLTPRRLEKLFPPIPGSVFSAGKIAILTLSLFLSLILAYGALVGFRAPPSPFKKTSARLTAEFLLTDQERAASVVTGGSYMYILTRDQAVSLYDRALALFTSFRDEAAKVNINRILESNASDGIKNKSRLLMLYMEVPGFHNFNRNDNVSISEVRSEPVLYRDVHVIWNGMAFNVELTDEKTSFDFLVGYDTLKTYEGIVKVVFAGPVAINTERPLEVLGKIALSSGNFSLEGVAIHQSGRLEN